MPDQPSPVGTPTYVPGSAVGGVPNLTPPPKPKPNAAPVASGATDEAFTQAHQEQDQALRNYVYLTKNPDEASKYGMDPADFRPKTQANGDTQFPQRTPEEGAAMQKSVEGYSGSEAAETTGDKTIDYAAGLPGSVVTTGLKAAGVSDQHAEMAGNVTNLGLFGVGAAKGIAGAVKGISGMMKGGEAVAEGAKAVEGAGAAAEGESALGLDKTTVDKLGGAMDDLMRQSGVLSPEETSQRQPIIDAVNRDYPNRAKVNVLDKGPARIVSGGYDPEHGPGVYVVFKDGPTKPGEIHETPQLIPLSQIEGADPAKYQTLGAAAEGVKPVEGAVSPNGEPPVPEGMTRLYRAETANGAGIYQPPEGYAPLDKTYFTKDRTIAEDFLKDVANRKAGQGEPQLSYLDVPHDVAKYYGSEGNDKRTLMEGSGGPGMLPHEVALPNEMAAGRTPLNGESSQATTNANVVEPRQATLTPDGQVVGDPKTLRPEDNMLFQLHNIFNQDVNNSRIYRSNATTSAAADKIPSQGLVRMLGHEGTNLNAEQTVALERVVKQQGKGIRDLMRAVTNEPDPAKRAVMREEFIARASAYKTWNDYAEAASRESGRGQQARQIGDVAQAIQSRKWFADDIRRAADADPDGFNKFALAIADAATPEEASEIVSQAAQPGMIQRAGDMALKWAMNAGLSSPSLPLKKLMTDGISLGSQVAAYSMNGRIWKAKDIPAGMDTAALHGLWEGLPNALRYALKSYKSGLPEWSMEHGVTTGYGTEALDGTPVKPAMDYLSYIGKRPIQALGEFSNAATYSMEMRAQAWKQAFQESMQRLGTDARPCDIKSVAQARYEAKMATMPKSLRDSALKQTEMLTFRNVTDGMKNVEDLRDSIDKSLGHIPLARMALLWFRTPWNLTKLDMGLGPLGFAQVAKNWGEPGNNITAAKASLGTAAMMMAMYMHHTGRMTGGGPADPAQRKARQAAGIPDYGIHIPGTGWHSLPDVPGTGAMRAALDFADIYPNMPQHDASSMLSMLGVVASRQLEHLPFMNLVTSLADFMTQGLRGEESNAGKNLGDYLSRLAVPAAVSKAAQAVDPIERELRSGLDEWKSKIPGWSKTIKPHVNIFGDSHYIAGGYKPEDAPGLYTRLENMFSPMPAKQVDEDPLSQEIERLSPSLNLPAKALGGRAAGNSPFKDNDPNNDAGYTMNGDEYYDTCVAAGNNHGEFANWGIKQSKYDKMMATVKSKEYQKLTDAQKKERLETINLSYNSMAEAQTGMRPEIQSKMRTQQLEQLARQTGKVSINTP